MLERRHDHFPKVFTWRGQCYDVHAVERCWTISRGVRSKRINRTCFRVRARRRADEGRPAPERFEIYLDAQRNTWHMQRRLA